MAMQGIISGQPKHLAFDQIHDENGVAIDFADGVARNAVRYADALLHALTIAVPTRQHREGK